MQAWVMRLALWLAALCAGAPLADAPLAHAAGAPASDLPRRALVIGNAAYKAAPLANPVNDARAMADTLRRLGFEVTQLEDASQRQMAEAIRAFGDALADGGGAGRGAGGGGVGAGGGGGSVGLFYYAGHGVQIGGQNYLIPVDPVPEREDEVPFKAVNAAEVLAKMQAARNPLNIVILDACRDNPFARGWRSAAAGLAQMEGPSGSIVALATAPGGVASDGRGRNGLYTSHLLAHMTEPGLKVEDVFKRVRRAVRRDTAGRQIPSEQTVLVDDFYFVPPAAADAGRAGPADAEQALWDAIQDSTKASDYRAYLERHPQGRFAALAQARAAEAAGRGRPAAAGVSQAARPSAAQAGPAGTSPPAPAGTLHAARAGASQAASEPLGRGASSFSFSAEEARMQQGDQARREESAAALRTACAPARRSARIRMEVGEQHLSPAGAVGRREGGSLADAIAGRLRAAGLTVSQAGPADYVLRGLITAQTSANRYLRLNEVAVSTAVSLIGASGLAVSNVVSRDESYAGSDVYGAFVDLVGLQADDVASRLYADFCRG